MVGVFVAFIRVVYGRMSYMSLPSRYVTAREISCYKLDIFSLKTSC